MYHIVFCCLVLLPYVSIGWRFPSQVQPWSALVAWFGVVFLLLNGQRLRLSRGDVWIIGMAAFMTLYAWNPFDLDVHGYLRRSVGVLFSLGIYLFGRTVSPRHLATATLIAVSIYLACATLQYVAPRQYTAIASHLVPDKNLNSELDSGDEFGRRGAESLTPEATDFGFTSVYLALFAVLAARAEAGKHEELVGVMGWTSKIGAALCVLASRSGSGILAGIALLASLIDRRLWTRERLVALSCAVIVIIGLVLLPPVQRQLLQMRGTGLLITAITNPAELNQTSFIHRYVHNVVGVIGFVESYGLGFGAGSFTKVAPNIYIAHGLDSDIEMSEYHRTAVLRSLEESPSGVVPMLLLEYGLLGLMFATVPFIIALRSPVHAKWSIIVLLALSWLQSFPIAYPPFWLLLSLTGNRQFMVPDSKNASGL